MTDPTFTKTVGPYNHGEESYNMKSLVSWKRRPFKWDNRSILYADKDNLVTGLFKASTTDDRYTIVFIVDGEAQNFYTCIRAKVPVFKSPLVNYYNLIFACQFKIRSTNGVVVNDKISDIKRVCDGKKPFTFACLDSYGEMDIALETITKAELPYVTENTGSEFMTCISVCQTGTLGENFDLDALCETYDILGKKAGYKFLSSADKEYILTLKDKPLSYWLTNWNRMSLSKARRDRVLSGLLFGNPIDMVASHILYEK